MKSVIKYILLALALVGILICGCTRHSTSDATIGMGTANSALATYFPTSEGWENTYSISSQENQTTLTFQIGGPVSVGGQTAYRWVIIPAQGNPDTNYVVIQSQALIVYQEGVSAAEHLLQLPLTTGASWLRFPDQPGGIEDTTSILTDITGGGNDTTSGPIARKLLPFEGGNELTVAGIENVVLSNNLSFTSAVKITNTDQYGNTNSYWFAPGVGLVKYVIGEPGVGAGGKKVGELITYGQRQ